MLAIPHVRRHGSNDAAVDGNAGIVQGKVWARCGACCRNALVIDAIQHVCHPEVAQGEGAAREVDPLVKIT